MLVGAGTVLTKENVDKAVAAGAKFIVSPVFDPEIVDYCIEKNVPIYPGCATPSEIMQGIKRGLGIVKFFPAADLGGAVTIKAIASALRGVKFMPTGGINRDNMRDYLSMDCVAAIGGSWMCKSGFISNGEFDRIEKLTREALYSADKIREEKHSSIYLRNRFFVKHVWRKLCKQYCGKYHGTADKLTCCHLLMQ